MKYIDFCLGLLILSIAATFGSLAFMIFVDTMEALK